MLTRCKTVKPVQNLKIIQLDQIVQNPGDQPLRLFGALRNYIMELKLQSPVVLVRLQVRSGLRIRKLIELNLT